MDRCPFVEPLPGGREGDEVSEALIICVLVARRAGIKVASLSRLHRRGLGPKGRVTIGTRSYYPAPEAERWLKEIHTYIATDNPTAAEKVIRGIYSRVEILRQFPEIGYMYERSPRHIRILLYGHYRIAYLVNDSRNCVILGVFHGALDIANRLK